MQLGLLKAGVNVEIIKYRKIFFLFSSSLVLLSFIFLFNKGLNLGIDFKGGIVIDAVGPGNYSKSTLLKQIKDINIEDVTIKDFNNNKIQLLINIDSLKNFTDIANLVSSVKKVIEPYNFNIVQSQFVGPSISKELLKGAIISITLSFLGIMLYLWIRFDWQYGLIGVIALVHDVIITLLFLSITSFEVNVSTIAALLTIVGYSINDTVVIFDQVRENVKKYINKNVSTILKISMNQILSRSLATSLTVFLVMFAIFLLGGESLKSFSFTLLIGVIFGTYSSLCIAAPLLMTLGNVKSKFLQKQ
jgi:preprotein translocase subunit SecF